MADPFEQERFEFARQLEGLTDPADRDAFKNWYVRKIEQRQPGNQVAVLNELRVTGGLVEDDLTARMALFSGPSLPAINRADALSNIETARSQTPWYRKGLANALNAVEWYQENVVEGTTAAIMAGAFKLMPGDQPFEKKMQESAYQRAQELGTNLRSNSVGDFLDTARDAYHETKTPWGLKGFMELTFDPLNLIGIGITSKLSTLAPRAIRPLLVPLIAIDNAPVVATNKLLSIPGSGLTVAGKTVLPGIPAVMRKVPGLRELAQPHFTSEVANVQGRIYESVSDMFGPLFTDGTPADTRNLLTDMNKWPSDTGTYSMRNVMNHMSENFRSVEAWESSWERILDLPPQLAASAIALGGASAERRVLREGGTTIGGKVIKESIRESRKRTTTDMLTRLRLDEQWSKGIAEGLDKGYQKFDAIYTRKIEPILVRRWATAQLAFTGFMPMNLVEDIGMSAVGLGVSPLGINDRLWSIMTTGLEGVPTHLQGAEGHARNLWDDVLKGPGADPRLRNAKTEGDFSTLSLLKDIIIHPVRISGELGWGIRRSAWVNKFEKELPKAMADLGIADAETDALLTLVRQAPKGSEEIIEDLGVMTWRAITTGDPASVRRIRELATTEKLMARRQMGALADAPELHPSIRKIYRDEINKGEGINQFTKESVRARVREAIVKNEEFNTAGIRAQYEWLNRVSTERLPKTPAEAMTMLSMMQGASDMIGKLPAEIRANTRRQVEALGRGSPKAGKLWDESLARISIEVAEVRANFNAAVARTKPAMEKMFAQASKQEFPTKQLADLGTGEKVQLISNAEEAAVSAADLALPEGLRRPRKETVAASIDTVFSEMTAVSDRWQTGWDDYTKFTDDFFSGVDRKNFTHEDWNRFYEEGNEVFRRTREDAATHMNRQRMGWNNLFTNVRRGDLNKRDLQFVRDGIESQINQSNQAINELRIDLAFAEKQIDVLPDTLRQKGLARTDNLKQEIIAAHDNVMELERQKIKFDIRKNVGNNKPLILREYDQNLDALETSIQLAADTPGLETHVGPNKRLRTELRQARARVFEQLIPPELKSRWGVLNENIVSAGNARKAAATDTGRKEADRLVKKATQARDKFRRDIEEGVLQAATEEQEGFTRATVNRLAKKIAESGDAPETINKTRGAVQRLADAGDEDAADFLRKFGNDIDEFETLYSRSFQFKEAGALSDVELQTLYDVIENPDHIPTSTIVDLVERGMIEKGSILRDGRWQLKLTDASRDQLQANRARALDYDLIESQLPPVEREFNSVVDGLLDSADSVLNKMADIGDNPPLRRGAEGRLGNWLDGIAGEMEKMPDFTSKMKQARSQASKTTTEQYNKFFVNYDNRSTFDFVMQRFMPFWMYESRRWGRLASIAAKRPMLAKQFTMVGGDWDYGYSGVGETGFQFHPAKGTLVGGLRRTLAREFPELHSGARGAVEQTTDWLGRGGFYFAPPITAAFDLLNGEPANIVPPPFAAAIHGIAIASGGELPPGLEQFAYSSRYMNFLIDQVIADKFALSPVTVRGQVEVGDPVAIGQMNLARQEASARMIAIQQSSVLRYKPKSKLEFLENSTQAVVEAIGLDEETQKQLRRLGIPLYSIVPVSGFQRKQMRETIPNYDAWIASNNSLRPAQEQKDLAIVDEFWQLMAGEQEKFEADSIDLSDAWAAGLVSGAAAKTRYSKLLTARSTVFDRLKSQARYDVVPITPEDRVKWIESHGSVPPLVHPVDEILEQYYSVTAEQFTDNLTGDIDWESFFAARDAKIEMAHPSIQPMIRDVLRKGDNPLERSLEASKVKLRAYYAVRTDELNLLAQNNPEAAQGYTTFTQLSNRAAISPSAQETRRLEGEARQILSHNPDISMTLKRIRDTRTQMRKEDPEMELIYQMWIAQPSTSTGPSLGPAQRPGGPMSRTLMSSLSGSLG